MGLDIILEADGALTGEAVAQSALTTGGHLLPPQSNHAFAEYPSGMLLWFVRENAEQEILAEDSGGMEFPVLSRCRFRIKGPETPGHSGLEELDAFVNALASNSTARFVVSFQYETMLYWRDSTGIHRAETQ